MLRRRLAGVPGATPSKALLTDRRILLVVTWLIEFSLFLCVFTVSRWLAEAGADLLEMGVVGGLFSLASGAASIVGEGASRIASATIA